MDMRYRIETFGCKANFADSVQIKKQLRELGWEHTPKSDDTEIVIVNTCGVTSEATEQGLKLIRKLKRESPNKIIISTGCAVEAEVSRFQEAGTSDFLIGNQNKFEIGSLLNLESLENTANLNLNAPQQKQSKTLGGLMPYREFASIHPIDREWPSSEDSLFDSVEDMELTSRGRGFLKIQEGCDSFCTYCIIPYGRGPSRSLSLEGVLTRLQEAFDQGMTEINLTGINLGEWGLENGTNLKELLLAVNQKFKGAIQVRLGSLDPLEFLTYVKPFLLSVEQPFNVLAPHFHLSIQSFTDSILKKMKRKYRTAETLECLDFINLIRSQSDQRIFVGMDLITGFPSETDEDFKIGFDRVSEHTGWNRIHVFPYSDRTGTPATKITPKVSTPIKKLRAKELRALSLRRLHTYYVKLIGSDLEKIEWEKQPKNGFLKGVTPDYLRVVYPINTNEELTSRLQNFRVKHVVQDPQKGEVVAWIEPFSK